LRTTCTSSLAPFSRSGCVRETRTSKAPDACGERVPGGGQPTADDRTEPGMSPSERIVRQWFGSFTALMRKLLHEIPTDGRRAWPKYRVPTQKVRMVGTLVDLRGFEPLTS